MSDPVADFLKEEEEAMKGLEDDDFGAPSQAHQQPSNEFDEFDTTPNMHMTYNGEDDHLQMNGDLVNGGSHLNGDHESLFNSHGSAKPREEPETLKKWREDESKYLKAQEEKEAKEMTAWRQEAAAKLSEMQKEYTAQIEKNKKKNREDEKDLIKQRDTVKPGQQWDRITQLCDFNAKTKNTKDTTRMREIMLEMKKTESA